MKIGSVIFLTWFNLFTIASLSKVKLKFWGINFSCTIEKFIWNVFVQVLIKHTRILGTDVIDFLEFKQIRKNCKDI